MSKTFHFPKLHLAAILGTVAVITPLMAFSTADVEPKRIEIPLTQPAKSNGTESQPERFGATLPAIEAEVASAVGPVLEEVNDETTPNSSDPELDWTNLTVKRGDTLSVIFKRAGFDDALMHRVLGSSKVAGDSFQRIYPGQSISFGSDPSGLRQIRMQVSELESVIVDISESGIETEKAVREPEANIAYASGTIESSLFMAGQSVGLPQSIIMDMANIFGWDIDFALDIRQGDHFELIFEELHLDGEKIGVGRILAANFTNDGRKYSAVYYENTEGDGHYYTPEGDSMRKAFIRSPVDFARISSHFSLNRKHPVLHRIRAHKGTDYAAGTGTPIKSTGDGKVIHAGNKGGYGRCVVIQHGQGITTLYAHMSKYAKNIKTGARVRQGQVIGYVGASGLASGPHLHYEFRVNGVHKNPVTVSLPHAQPIPAGELARFKEQTGVRVAQLDTFSASQRVAFAR